MPFHLQGKGRHPPYPYLDRVEYEVPPWATMGNGCADQLHPASGKPADGLDNGVCIRIRRPCQQGRSGRVKEAPGGVQANDAKALPVQLRGYELCIHILYHCENKSHSSIPLLPANL